MGSSQAQPLGDHPFLDELSASALAMIVGCAHTIHRHPGETIFRHGGLADHFFLIRSGLVSIVDHLPVGRQVTVQTLGDGDVLGWEWLVPPYEWHFDGVVAQPVMLISFDAIALRQLCQTDRDLGYQLYQRFLPVMAHVVHDQRLVVNDLARTPTTSLHQLNG